MRKIPEAMLKPLLRILNEYEAEIRAKQTKTLSDDIKLWHINNIYQQLNKRF